MLYVVIKPIDDDNTKHVCLVRAKSEAEALKIVDMPDDYSDWTVFTEEQVKTLMNMDEGYLVNIL